jgi:hypothetical protein
MRCAPTENERCLDCVDLARVGSRAVAHRLQRLAVGGRVYAEDSACDKADVGALLRDETAHESFVRGTGQSECSARRLHVSRVAHR